MRLLLATDGTWGDVGPQLAIAHALTQRGHTVRALLNPSFTQHAERLGLENEGVGVPWEERLEGIDPAVVMRPFAGTFRVMRDFLLPSVPDWAAATRRAIADFAPDAALVHHISWGALAATAQSRLPIATTFLAPMVLLSTGDPGRPAATMPPMPPLAMRLERPLLVRMFRLLLDRPARPHFAAAGLPAPRDLYFLAERAARLSLALWPTALRGPAADDPESLHICGYAFPLEPDPLDPALEAFLDAGEPPVVVTLGTSAREMGLALYTAAAAACARIGRRAVLLTGETNRPATLPDGVATFAEAPHGRLLPRAAAVVHHGGAGTTGQALRAGVPAVVVPFGHDQADNAHRAHRLAGSRVLRRRRATAQRLARALADLLESKSACEAARSAGERVRAEDGAAHAADRIEGMAHGAGKATRT